MALKSGNNAEGRAAKQAIQAKVKIAKSLPKSSKPAMSKNIKVKVATKK